MKGTMPSKRQAKTALSSEKVVSAPSKKLKGQEDEEAAASSAPEVAHPSRKAKDEIASDEVSEARFFGPPVPEQEAKQRWPHRYLRKKKRSTAAEESQNDDLDKSIQARYHYLVVEDGKIHYNLYDDAHVKAGEGEEDYICKIVELFVGVDGKAYFAAQWYYRAKDTVIKDHEKLINSKRVFFSEIRDDNPLDCLVKKLLITRLTLNVDSNTIKQSLLGNDFYCDMQYLIPYSSFVKLPEGLAYNCQNGCETSSTISSDLDMNEMNEVNSGGSVSDPEKHDKPDVKLLDLYSGCGAMSTGLCLGAQLSGLNLVTRWAVDLNKHACDSLKLNHPETDVRNEAAEDFLTLLKEWKKLCVHFSLVKSTEKDKKYDDLFSAEGEEEDDIESDEDEEDEPEVFEVQKLLEICHGDPKENGKPGLYFKVRWKGYGAEADSWEPIEGLSHCEERIKDYVTSGFKLKILPLPGDVDVICGGPPCQGISGFNRFRNKENPLKDEKNKQLIVFMDLVDYLKPKYVLMENVVDIVKFASGFLGRYALGRLISMNYQVRMGMLAAGAFGLPQFRMRVFMWGARPTEKLPQYPLPTHDVVVRGVIPVEFEMNAVAYDEGQKPELERRLILEDAISDLPAIGNNEHRDEMPFHNPPRTEFQRFIRSKREKPSGLLNVLYDHRPLELNADDYQRVCRIQKSKGANFRNLPGVRVRPDKKVEWDPDVERVYLESGKPLVPDYAMSFVNGSSSKPFARLWWDETVPTVVTRAEPHNQAILHPEQDRVLSIRENARLQGFPDYYKLRGPVKERYIQVGNAVAVPVARALGYGLGIAYQGTVKEGPVFQLPRKFPNTAKANSFSSSQEDA